MAMLVDRGLVDYDDLVSEHWPEFGVHGKEEITVADVMRHEGGVPHLADPTAPGDVSRGFVTNMNIGHWAQEGGTDAMRCTKNKQLENHPANEITPNSHQMASDDVGCGFDECHHHWHLLISGSWFPPRTSRASTGWKPSWPAQEIGEARRRQGQAKSRLSI